MFGFPVHLVMFTGFSLSVLGMGVLGLVEATWIAAEPRDILGWIDKRWGLGIMLWGNVCMFVA